VQTGLSEAALEQPIDEDLKRRRLAEYLSSHFDKTSSLAKLISSYDTEPDSDYSSDSNSDAGSADGEILRFSQYLESKLRTSHALIDLRSSLKMWIEPVQALKPKAEESIRLDEILMNLVASIAFIPREHITQACILGSIPNRYIGKLQLLLEAYTRENWDWWPLKPPSRPSSNCVQRVQWQCVSIFFLCNKPQV
jgi:hypothetical protein